PAAPFPSQATNSLYWYSPPSGSGSPWNFTSAPIPGDGAGLVANGSAFNNPDAPKGNQAAFLQRKGSFSQAVPFAAGPYTLNFKAAQRLTQNQTFEVYVDDNLVGTFQPAGVSYQDFTTGAFPVTAGSHTIEFLGTNANSADNSADNTAFIDSVSVSGSKTNWQATINRPIDGL